MKKLNAYKYIREASMGIKSLHSRLLGKFRIFKSGFYSAKNVGKTASKVRASQKFINLEKNILTKVSERAKYKRVISRNISIPFGGNRNLKLPYSNVQRNQTSFFHGVARFSVNAFSKRPVAASVGIAAALLTVSNPKRIGDRLAVYNTMQYKGRSWRRNSPSGGLVFALHRAR